MGVLEGRIGVFQLQKWWKGGGEHYSRWRDQCEHMQGDATGVQSCSRIMTTDEGT